MHRLCVDGTLFLYPDAVLLHLLLSDGNVVVHGDVDGLPLHVELDCVGAGRIDNISHEEVFESTRPAIEHDHRGDEVAVAKLALLSRREDLLVGEELDGISGVDLRETLPRHWV